MRYLQFFEGERKVRYRKRERERGKELGRDREGGKEIGRER